MMKTFSGLHVEIIVTGKYTEFEIWKFKESLLMDLDKKGNPRKQTKTRKTRVMMPSIVAKVILLVWPSYPCVEAGKTHRVRFWGERKSLGTQKQIHEIWQFFLEKMLSMPIN